MAEVETIKKTAPKAPKTAQKADSTQFAVFATGGKQYLVVPGESLKIEKILPSTSSGQAAFKEGDKIVFNEVLLSGDATTATLGTPFIKGAAINTTLKKISRYKTIDVIKYKQKSRYFKKNGHRQPYFEVTIDSIK